MKKKHFKTVFISDLHLGSKACKTYQLDKFLSSFTTDELFLIGDIIDGYQLTKRNSYFPQDHVNIIRKILTKAKNGTKVYYVIGNHDDFLRKYTDLIHSLGNIMIGNEFLFTSLLGKRYLITHGDMYDSIMKHQWLVHLGDNLYTILVDINTILNNIRRKFGFGYWSLAGYLKTKVKQSLEFINNFESLLVHEAKRKGLDGVICGHIHHSSFKIIDDIEYYNDGDFCDSCSAIVEHFDGVIEVINVQEYLDELKIEEIKR